VDVRSSEAFREGHPAGAIHAPAHAFLDEYSRQGLGGLLQVADGIVVLCESDRCFLGDSVAKQLMALGHEGVYVFDGGWEAFRISGSRIAKGL
jgi:rhodanese-related sulfurtransferase